MKDFEKFDLYKKGETIATDNTLPVVAPSEEVKKGEWISVKDRLPEFGIKVLVFVAPTHPVMEGYVIRIDRRVEVSGKKTGGSVGKYLTGKLSSYAFTTGEVSHWMHLPNPPVLE